MSGSLSFPTQDSEPLTALVLAQGLRSLPSASALALIPAIASQRLSLKGQTLALRV